MPIQVKVMSRHVLTKLEFKIGSELPPVPLGIDRDWSREFIDALDIFLEADTTICLIDARLFALLRSFSMIRPKKQRAYKKQNRNT
jgi:hypothetical protein